MSTSIIKRSCVKIERVISFSIGRVRPRQIKCASVNALERKLFSCRQHGSLNTEDFLYILKKKAEKRKEICFLIFLDFGKSLDWMCLTEWRRRRATGGLSFFSRRFQADGSSAHVLLLLLFSGPIALRYLFILGHYSAYFFLAVRLFSCAPFFFASVPCCCRRRP